MYTEKLQYTELNHARNKYVLQCMQVTRQCPASTCARLLAARRRGTNALPWWSPKQPSLPSSECIGALSNCMTSSKAGSGNWLCNISLLVNKCLHWSAHNMVLSVLYLDMCTSTFIFVCIDICVYNHFILCVFIFVYGMLAATQVHGSFVFSVSVVSCMAKTEGLLLAHAQAFWPTQRDTTHTQSRLVSQTEASW